MASFDIVQLSIVALSALAAGGTIYVLLSPLMSGQSDRKKRLASVAGGPRVIQKREAEHVIARRRQVQETLQELNERTSASKKISLRRRLEQAGLAMTPNTYYVLSAVTGIVVMVLVALSGVSPFIALLAGGAASYGLPRYMLTRLARRRQRKFLEEFANTIDIVVRGVKSGLPLNDCLEIIAKEAPEPIRSEFQLVVEQQRVGVPLLECFNRLRERVPLQEVNFFSIVIAIQQQSGGNLAEALNNLAEVLRGRKRLQGKVQAFSSEAKSSAMIIGALPFIVMLLVYMTTPAYISLLWEHQWGRAMLAASGVWMLLGIFVMHRMINFDY